MHITQEWTNRVWPELVTDAGMARDRAQLIIVRATRPNGSAECAYCQPSFNTPLDSPGVYQVIRRIGDRAYEDHHVVAVWEELPGSDEVAAAALLRHEIEHARQWESWGPPVMDELDAELKGILRAKDETAYHRAPSEYAADDAARDWVSRQYGPAEAQRLEEAIFPYWQQAVEGARGGDLRGETIAALRAEAPARHEVSMPGGDSVSIEDFIAARGDWVPMEAPPRGDGAEIEFVD